MLGTEYKLVYDIALIIGSATILGYVMKLLRQPLLLGYVIAGVLLGPVAFGLITEQADINILSEIGIALLLFGAGVEINLSKMREVGAFAAVGCVLQVALTFAAGYFISLFAGLNSLQATFIGAIIAFSSTMIIVKTLSDRKEMDTLHGRLLMGIMIAQDIIVITVLPLLQNVGSALQMDFITRLLLSGGTLFVIAVIANKYLFRPFLNYAAEAPELLFLTAITICFSFMGLAYVLNFSIAIGAFLAGIMMSSFSYNLEIWSKMRSLRDFFATLFFVSLGLHITTGLTMADMGLAALLIFAVIFIKPLITSIICLLFGYGERTSLLVGLGMGQISEFSFLIASTALAAGIFTQNLFSVVTIAIIFTIVLTPYVFKYGNVLYVALDKTRKILRIPEIGFLKRKSMDEKGVTYQRNHVVIVGCDRMGGRLLEKLRKDRVFITDFNPDIIRSMKAQGVPCVYGDAFSDDIVEKMNLPRAAVVVSTIPDHRTTLSLIARAKKANRHVIFIAHANRPEKALEFYEAGADVVVMPESVAGQKMAQIISLALQAPGKLKEIKHGHLHWLEHDISKEQRSKKLIRRFINVHDRQYGGEHVSPQQKTQALRKKFTDKRMQVHAKKQH